MTNSTITKHTQWRLTATLFLAQSSFSAAMIAAFTLMPIIAVQIGGRDSVAGWPSTAILIGRGAIAFPIGWLMDRIGRRLGLSLGYALAVAGMLVVLLSIVDGSLVGLLFGALLFGMGRGTSDQGRYAAAEVFSEERRAKVIGLVVFAGTIGAVGGPLLVSPSSRAAQQAGFLPDIGPFALAAGLALLALLLVFIFLRPDPLVIGRATAGENETTSALPLTRSFRELLMQRKVILAIGAMTIGQLVMTLIMVITPLHMNYNHHDKQAIALVVMAHTLGMFGLSGLSGWLIDRYGRLPMIVLGGIILAAAGLLTPISASVPSLSIALFLLGLGWNFAFVAGSSLLSDALGPHERGRIQGASDSFVALASGIGSFGTGFVFAAGGIVAVSGVGLGFALALLASVALFSFTRPAVVKVGD